MNTLKSAALIVVLLGVLYGVYVTLNQPLPRSRPGQEPPEVEAPLVEFGPAESAGGVSAIPAAPPLVLAGDEESPASSAPSRPARGGAYQPNLDTASLVPPAGAAPEAGLEATGSGAVSPLKRSTYEGPAGSENAADAGAAAATREAGSSSEAATDAATEAARGGSGPSGRSALVAWSLKHDWQEAEQLVADGKFRAALARLSPYYTNPDLPAEQRPHLVEWLDALAAKVIYSREHLLAAPHRVRRGETLFQIADQYNVPWRLLQSINSHLVTDPMVLVPGTELKVVPGPFRADVNLATGELTLFLDSLYAGRFPFTLGDQPPAAGQYKVVDKMKEQKSYYGLDGRVIGGNDPNNPYGGWWISLGGEVCIHGSPAVPTAKPLGCVSLSPQDAKDVYGILSMGSEVTIRR